MTDEKACQNAWLPTTLGQNKNS